MTIKGVKDILNPLQGFRKRFIAPLRQYQLDTMANIHLTAQFLKVEWTEVDGDGVSFYRSKFDNAPNGDSEHYDINPFCTYDVIGDLYINTLNAQFVQITIINPDDASTIYYESWSR